MTNFLVIVVFVLGFVLILKGGDFLVESSVELAKKAKIPPIIVGATVVAIATTFPETTVSLISSFTGAEQVGINTAVGSMVCNFTIVLGLSFLIFPCRVQAGSFIVKTIYFCLSVFVLLVVGLNGRLGIVEAIVLALMFLAFIIVNCIEAKKIKSPEFIVGSTQSWLKIMVKFFISAFAIGLGAIVLVNNVDNISAMLGIKGGIVGFVIIAIGTNIPELVTTITSVKLSNPEIGIGNIFGASVIDCTMLIACSVFASGNSFISISPVLLLITAPMLLLITGIIALPIIKNQRTFRWQGVALILLYFIYTGLIVKFT